MKLTNAFVVTILTAGSLIACRSAVAQDSTNAPAPAPALPTNSPSGGPRMMPRGPSIEGLARVLNLTDAQKAQVQPILAEEYKKMRDLRNDTSLSVDERRAKMKEIRDETSAKVQPVLTPEQFEKWQSRTRPRHPRPQGTPNVSTNSPAGNAP